MYCRKQIVIILSCVFVLVCGPVLAHLPRIAGLAAGTTIRDPEISQAFYGKLDGASAIYTINASSSFHLYLQLLSPQTAAAKTDFSATIQKDGQLLANLESADGLWSVTYEPFGNDYYFQGPELEKEAAPGVYTIQVLDPDNKGVYVLAVGKKEVVSVSEFFKTLAALPVIKSQYFNEPAWTAYNNFTGLFALVIVVVAGIVLYVLIRLVYTWRLNKKMDYEYKNLREAGGKDSHGLS